MKDCVFCKIISKQIPTEIEKESTNLVVFKDVKPAAPMHLLIVSKKHMKDITESDTELWQEIAEVAKLIISEKSLVGFRLVHNGGAAVEVPHLHVHLMGPIAQNS